MTLLAGPGARASGWAAAAAVAVARGWPGSRRVVLADLDFGRPTLHELLGAPNEEGAVDVVDYGLSLGHVLQVVDDGGFDLIAAGLYAPDPEATLRSRSWGRVIAEVGERRATLLAYLPSEAAGAEALVERTGAVLVLASADEWRTVAESLTRPYGIIGVLTPPAQPASGAGAAVQDEPLVAAAAAEEILDAAPEGAGGTPRLSDEEFERIRLPKDRVSRESLIADLRERQRAARLAQPDPVEPPVPGAPAATRAPVSAVALPAGAGDAAVELRLESAADDVPLDALDPAVLVPRSRPPRPRTTRYQRPLAWTLTVVALVALLAGAWHFLAGRLMAVDPVPAPEAAAPAVVEPPVAQTLPFVVAVEAHRDLETALGRVDALAAAGTSVAFHVSPLEVDGTLFYHVMAGPVADSAGAVALRDRLVAGGHKTGTSPSDVRHAPLAFLIGDYTARDSADRQLDELRRLDMPGYRVMTEAADGAPLHRIYVGGFGAAAEADVIRQMLRSAGIRDSLVTRTGSSTQ